MKKLRRFHGFLLVSAVLIGAAVIVSGLVVGWFFERNVLANEEAQTARVVQVQAQQHLVPSDFELPRPWVEREVFQAFLRELPGAFRIKVFDRTGRIVWSDEPRLIGRTFPDNLHVANALKGQAGMVLEVPHRAEHEYERSKGYVAEAYVPITLPGSVGPVGVIETYKDVSGVVLEIRGTQRLIWGFTGGIGLFLYVALAFVVRRASANEQRAMRRLETAHEQLAAILAGIADRMLIVDRQMRVVWMNAAATETAGGSGASLGRLCFQALDGEAEACENCPAVRTFVSGRVERGVRIQRLPGGEVRHLDLVTAPLRDGAGRVHQVLEVARDITELVQIEERLKQSASRIEESNAALLAKTEELEKANRALRKAQSQLVESERLVAVSETVVGLHHAILNPLTGVLGAFEVLKQESMGQAEKAEALVQAEAELRKVVDLIRRLPDIRRARGTSYVGETTMLDLERSLGEEGQV